VEPLISNRRKTHGLIFALILIIFIIFLIMATNVNMSRNGRGG
jgi:hypothetical protein